MKKLFFPALMLFAFSSCNNESASEEKAEHKVADTTETKAMAPAEFADMKYADVGKKGVAALSAGDVDGWLANYADNAVYVWNNGDSLAGKPAIEAYWKKRRSEVIDSITFNKAIWLPVKVNTPQSIEAPGVWLLCWYQVIAKYKTGKSMSQWMHTDMHFDAADKIDRVIMYMDRAPINEANKK